MDNRYYIYITLQGDTFDMIALDFYNDESMASLIIDANPDYRSTLLFDAGVTLSIPAVDSQSIESLPPWKR